jgi:DNA polymerase-3 subunit delta
MIVKSFEVNKKLIQNKKFFLMYGENQGLKNETIQKEFKKNYPDSVYNYDENEILSNEENFFENISSKSFFEKEKLIIINRVTDKIKNLIEEIVEKKIADLVIILNANSLEKKSKLRSYFEKTKDIICIPFYNDNNQTLSIIVGQFFRGKKIPISQKLINLVVQRSRGDRQNLNNELKKIENFVLNKSKIEINDILKLTNLAENYSVSELVDNCLAKNKRTTINILNENNYSLDDCILVIRTFLLKSKRILKLKKEFKINNNMETTLSSSKPPIFWKDKEIVKQQIKCWSNYNIENLVYKINEIELLIKKNTASSINILSDFIIEQATTTSN